MEAQRAGFPDLEMHPAPGYDPLMPHDMIHLVVEAQLGLTHGIFGQLASGGDAGTFRLFARRDDGSREKARTQNRVKARGRKLLKNGRDECAQSEQATFICWNEWRARSSSREVRDTGGVAELRTLNRRKLDEICKHLDQLSAQWSSLKVGQSMAVTWPDLAIVPEVE